MSLKNANAPMVSPNPDNEEDSLTLLISESIEGCLNSRRELSNKISLKLRSYIYRSTLDDNLTDDILQETMMIMIDKIGSLKSPEAFWSWIFKISSNCIIDYYRQNSKRKKLLSFQDIMIEKAASDNASPEARLMTRELSDTVHQAISMLKPRQRQTISLRCFEDLSFKEIGSILNISEVSARVDFHRGLDKIRQSLKKQGFSKASLGLVLTFFGKITAHSDAAAFNLSVSNASLVTAATAGSSSIPSAAAAKVYCTAAYHPIKTALSAFLILAGGIFSVFYINGRHNITSAHYNVQGLYRLENEHNQNVYNNSLSLSKSQMKSSWEYGCKGFYEQKILMPQGPDGPILRYMFRLGMPEESKLCKWLQDGSANYYYESGTKVIYITNDPLRMLVMPTDTPAMANFIYQQIGQDNRLDYNRDFFSRAIKSTIDNRTKEYENLKFEYTYNSLNMQGLKSDWPEDAVEIIDQRDKMHKRGWTYFDISGNINDKPVTGFGRVPFIYNKYQAYKPYLLIKIGNDKYINYENEPALISTGGKTQYYKNDTLFTCLPRPWTGYAFVDSVCRDAAKFHYPFEILTDTDTDATVRVYLFSKKIFSFLLYDIDRYNDIIRSVKFISNGKEIGTINFSYLQNLPNHEDKYYMPQHEITNKVSVKKQKDLWLKKLMQN